MPDNPYHNGGGGGGGGFVQNSPYGSQESPGGTKKRANSSIRPVTALQVIEAQQVHQDADYSIDGYDVGQLLLVGSVVNLSVSATNVSYTISDGTGHVEVRRWLDSQDENSAAEGGAQQDKYITVLGTIKTFNRKRHVNAQHVRTIDNPDAVAHHLLKAQWVSLSLTRPGGGGGAAGNGAAAAGSRAGAGADAYSAGATYGAGAGGGNDNFAHLPPVSRKIMEYVAKDVTDEGVHVSAITKQVGNSNTEAVMEAIENLMGEGLLFSTIDDLHVKAVE